MKKIIFFSFLIFSSFSYASGDHDHGHEEKHDSEHEGEHKDEHSEDGFKLTEKSVKKFGLKTQLHTKEESLIPNSAIYRGLNEVNIYRLRDGLYKRIDFVTVKKGTETLTIKSKDLKKEDQIVISGVGFLRIAEIAASGGISDSHSH